MGRGGGEVNLNLTVNDTAVRTALHIYSAVDPGKCMNNLWFVVVSELSRGEPSLKRKFDEEPIPSEMNASAELSQEKESEETSEETASDADSAATSTDNDFNSEAFYEVNKRFVKVL